MMKMVFVLFSLFVSSAYAGDDQAIFFLLKKIVSIKFFLPALFFTSLFLLFFALSLKDYLPHRTWNKKARAELKSFTPSTLSDLPTVKFFKKFQKGDLVFLIVMTIFVFWISWDYGVRHIFFLRPFMRMGIRRPHIQNRFIMIRS